MRNLITSPQALSDHWRYVVSLVFRKHLFLKTNQTRAGNFNCTSTYSSSLSHATPHTVVHFYIHTARKTDGELDSLTVLLSWKENKNHPRWDSNPGKTEYKFRETSFYRLRQLSHKPLTNDDFLHFRQRKFSDKGIFHFKKNKSVYFCTVIFVNIVFVYVRKVRNFSDLSIYLQEDPKKGMCWENAPIVLKKSNKFRSEHPGSAMSQPQTALHARQHAVRSSLANTR